MGLFNRSKKSVGNTEEIHDNRIEVVVQQNARKEVVDEAKATNKKLKTLLEENGFTLRIYLAAGGQLHGKPKKVSGHK